MIVCLILLWLFNLIDTAATLYFTTSGIMTELNPVMAALLESPEAFVAVKIGAMTAICIYLWLCRKFKFARIAALLSMLFYGCIAIYYIVSLCTIGGMFA